MKCPYCNQEMIRGIIRIDTNGTLYEQKFIPDGVPEAKEAKKIFRRSLGVWGITESNIKDCTEAYFCENCKIVLGIFPFREYRWVDL